MQTNSGETSPHAPLLSALTANIVGAVTFFAAVLPEVVAAAAVGGGGGGNGVFFPSPWLQTGRFFSVQGFGFR